MNARAKGTTSLRHNVQHTSDFKQFENFDGRNGMQKKRM